ncbi:hypothetical protein [Rhizobium sp. AAP43]|uniref:hypothetical protein n=1 Tax=Rhizobium sp. AAP43 TaxID=1523420 RepID=UPI000B1FE199|nr:hypothetical protein [Rhizobium sp. AAP43]
MSDLATLETSELVATIARARVCLDEGDAQAALLLSSGAYDKARAAGAYAARVKASRSLVDKARLMQADALKIEALAYCAMADTVDEAQAKGAISRGGRPETVQGEDRFSLAEVGIDKRRLHEARSLRNAERQSPGFVERIVEARLEEGLEPSRASLKAAAGHAIGTKTATKEERGDDLYETPIEAVRVLLALESFRRTVWEPSVGKGAILRPLEAAGYDVRISDSVDRGMTTQHGECQSVADFLKMMPDADFAAGTRCGPDIVTNPPYGIANSYIAHALRAFRPGKMAMLLNLNFLAGFEDPDRCFVMDENPPSRIYVFTRRLPMMHRDGWDGPKASSQMNTAWFVWERQMGGERYGHKGYPEIIRVDWQAFAHAEPLAPGEGGHVAPTVVIRDDEDFTRETPRKTLDERVDEDMDRALAWICDTPASFDSRALRMAIAVRPTTADEIIARLSADGRIIAVDGGWCWAGDEKAVAA